MIGRPFLEEAQKRPLDHSCWDLSPRHRACYSPSYSISLVLLLWRAHPPRTRFSKGALVCPSYGTLKVAGATGCSLFTSPQSLATYRGYTL
ncbi:hypothetical protein BDW75DRAFT_190857 [Aspergillus navahoensis]